MYRILRICLNFIMRLVLYLGIYSFIFIQIISPVYATVNISIINKVGSNTNKLNSANGIPIVNINKVDGKRQSFNEFDILNVGKEGLIFNNSATLISTQLAGLISANNNLNPNQEATLIISTVRSKRSELMGYMEIAGKKSDFIILNQNGIVCDGCGFINVNRAILSTGTSILDDENFVGIVVNKGEVQIGKGGFNGLQTNRIDIISQQLRLNGELHGKTVSISLGDQEYNYEKDIFKATDQRDNTSKYVISSNEFGGMYGDTIRLISNDNSIGVNIDFNMVTSGSDITIDSAGNLKVSSKINSSEDININAQDIQISDNADIFSNNNLIFNGANFYTSGNISSLNDITLNFDTIRLNESSSLNTKNKAVLNANNKIDIYGNLFTENGLDLKAAELSAAKQVQIVSYGNIGIVTTLSQLNGSMSSKRTISVESDELWLAGNIASKDSVSFNAKVLNIEEADIVGVNINIFADELNIAKDSSLNSKNKFTIELNDNFNIYEGIQIGSMGEFIIKAHDINIHRGSKLSSDGNLNIRAYNVFVGTGNGFSKVNNRNTYLSGNKGLSIHADEIIEIQTKGNLTSKGDLEILSNSFTNRGFVAGNNLFATVWDFKNLGSERIGTSYNSYDNMGVVYAINNIDIKGKDGLKARNVVNSSAKIQAKNGNLDITTINFENILSWWDFREQISPWRTMYEDRLVYESGRRQTGHSGDKYGYIDKTKQSVYEKDVTYSLYGAKEATVSVGGNINIKGDNFTNKSSNISSGGEININTRNFKSETLSKQNYTDKKVVENYYKEHQYSNRYGCGFLNYKYCYGSWKHDYNEHSSSSTKIEKVYGVLNTLSPTRVSSASNINIRANNKFNNGGLRERSTVNIVEDINWSINMPSKGAIVIGDIPVLNLDGNMFHLNGTSGYMIETNPWFTDEQNFKGSSYYLDLMGLNVGNDEKLPAKDLSLMGSKSGVNQSLKSNTNKSNANQNSMAKGVNHLMLGDAYVDLEIVTKQILDKVGKQVLDKYHTKEEQLEGLMQAGVNTKEDLGLIIGKSLTQYQLSQLKQPIVWWVYQEFNGSNVLVPQVFYPTDQESTYDKNQHGNNSAIIGASVDIEVGGDATNEGNIFADNAIFMNVGGDFYNRGNFVNKDTSIKHKQNMENLSKQIKNNVYKAEELGQEYEKLNKKYESRNKIYEGSVKEFHTKEAKYQATLAKVQNIKSQYSEKDLAANPKLNNILIQENIKLEKLVFELQNMQDTLSIYATALGESAKELNNKANTINALAVATKGLSHTLDNYVDKSTNGVEINVGDSMYNGGNINADRVIINAQNNFNDTLGNINSSLKTIIMAKEINLEGSKLSSAELNLNANDINIKAHELHDIEFYKNHNQATGLVRGELSGSNINFNSKNNIFVSSSNIFGDNILLDAKGDITVTAQKTIKKLTEEAQNVEIVYTDINTQQQVSGKLSEVSGARLIDAYEINNIGSSIIANNELNFVSKNTLIEGSNIFSEGLLGLLAEKDITIRSLEDEKHIVYEVSQEKTEEKGKWYKFNTSSTTTTTNDRGSISSKTNQSSNVMGNTILINALNDVTLQGANIGSKAKEEAQQALLQPHAMQQKQEKQEDTIFINAGNNFNQLAVHDSMDMSLNTNTKQTIKGWSSADMLQNAKATNAMFKAMTKNSSNFLGKSTNEGIKVLTALGNTSQMLGSIGKLTEVGSLTYSETTSITDTSTDLSTSTVVSSNILADNIFINANNNLKLEAGNIKGSKDLVLDAGHDLIIKEDYNTAKQKQRVENKTTTASLTGSLGLTGVDLTATFSGSTSSTGSDFASRTVVGSSLSGGNIRLNSGNNTSLTSADLQGLGDINILSGNDTVLSSAQSMLQSSFKKSSGSHNMSVSAGMTFGGTPKLGLNVGKSGSNESGGSIRVEHSQGGMLAGGNINIQTVNDFSMEGGLINAEQELSLETKNVSIVSVQDIEENYKEGNLWGGSVGAGFGQLTVPNNVSLGGNLGENKARDKSVSMPIIAGLVGGDGINIETKGDLNLLGATIDGGTGININMGGTLNVQKLENYSTSTASGFNVGYVASSISTSSISTSGVSTSGVATSSSQRPQEGVINKLFNVSTGLNTFADNSLLGFNFALNKLGLQAVEQVQGSINNNGIITADTVLLDNKVSTVGDIHNKPRNNREIVFKEESSYNFTVNPKLLLNNMASSIDVLREGTDLGGKVYKAGFKVVSALNAPQGRFGERDILEGRFWETFNNLGKVAIGQKSSAESNINMLDNVEQFKAMQEGIWGVDVDVLFMAESIVGEDGIKVTHGSSSKEANKLFVGTMGVNGLAKSPSSIENTYYHELAHIMDLSRKDTAEDRERRELYARNIGNSAEHLGQVNTFLYGSGGLTNSNITQFNNENQALLQQNTNYLKSLDPYSLEDKALMFARAINDPLLAFLYDHQGMLFVDSESNLNKHIKELGLMDNNNTSIKPMKASEVLSKEVRIKHDIADDNYILLAAAYKGSNMEKGRKENKGKLTKDFNNPADIRAIRSGDKVSMQGIHYGADDKRSEAERDKSHLQTANNYNNKAKYSALPVVQHTPIELGLLSSPPYYYMPHTLKALFSPSSSVLLEQMKAYNSNSFAATICEGGGGTNCKDKDFNNRRISPGLDYSIPNIFFQSEPR